MKTRSIFLFLLFSFFAVNMINAQQAVNNTADTWIASYQNADTVVPPFSTVTITLGTNTNAGIGVYMGPPFLPGGCGNKFQASGTWVSTCAPNTTTVTYNAIGIIFPPPLPVFVFN